MLAERVILAASDDENESEDDLYKGYNDFNPVLDTRVRVWSYFSLTVSLTMTICRTFKKMTSSKKRSTRVATVGLE